MSPPRQHGRRNAFHYIRAGAGTVHNGHEAQKQRQAGHQHRPYPVAGADHDGRGQVQSTFDESCVALLPPREIQIQHHQETQLDRETRDRDHADRHGHTQVVTKRGQQPDAADERERQRRHHHQRLGYGFAVHVEHEEDDENRQWHQNRKPCFGPFEVGKLTGPVNALTGRDTDLVSHDSACQVNVIGNADVIVHINEYKADQLTVFVPECRRTGTKVDIGGLGDGDLCAG